jgi:hypothetical protein
MPRCLVPEPSPGLRAPSAACPGRLFSASEVRQYALVSSSVGSGPSLPYETWLPNGERGEIPVRPSFHDIGEGFVLHWLTKKLGFTAELTHPGARDVDIHVTAPVAFDVQVKTATSPSWHVGPDKGVHVAPNLWFVLVEWDRISEGIARAFVLRSDKVSEIANEQHEAWRVKAGPDAKPRGRRIVEGLSTSSGPLDLKPFETWDELVKLGTTHSP